MVYPVPLLRSARSVLRQDLETGRHRRDQIRPSGNTYCSDPLSKSSDRSIFHPAGIGGGDRTDAPVTSPSRVVVVTPAGAEPASLRCERFVMRRPYTRMGNAASG